MSAQQPEPAPKPRTGPPPWVRAVLIAIGLFVFVTWSLSWGNKPDPVPSNAGLGRTVAEVACERAVRDELGGRPKFKQGAHWEISRGWQINGRATLDGREVGYSCEVTGPEGQHKTEIISLG